MRDSIRSAILSLFLVCAVTAGADRPRLTRVIAGRDAADLTVRITGLGLSLGRHESPLFDAAGNEIVWREVRRTVDGRGGVHIRYRQYLAGDGFEAELVGSSMLTHWDAGGALDGVDGVQFEKVKLANRPVLAPQAVMQRVATRFAEEAAGADLKLVPEGDAFRFVYYTRAAGEDGTPLRVVVDAESEKVLSRSATGAPGNCSSTAAGGAVAVIDPVRPELPLRTNMWVTKAWRGDGFEHEASLDYGYFNITAFQQVLDSRDSTFSIAWKCDPHETRSYTVFPVKADDGTTTPLVFRNRPSGIAREWQGSVAGDAYWNTYQTMRTFANFGRDGWNGQKGEANIVIDADGNTDVAFFNYGGLSTAAAPSNAVVIRREGDFYSLAASLDSIAHEWGHGMVFSDVGWDYSGGTGDEARVQRELHEGWADVIAMIVEKRRQPAGYELEQDSDWEMHEDSGTGGYARGASDDGNSHTWRGKPRTDGQPVAVRRINDKVHRLDDAGTTGTTVVTPFTDHSHGNMLNVVHRLMSEGGTNSACGRLSQTPETCPPVTGIGTSKAGLILFHAIQNRLGPHHRWDTQWEAVRDEAFAQYNGCAWERADNAETEQLAVINAFKNIGYAPANAALKPCP